MSAISRYMLHVDVCSLWMSVRVSVCCLWMSVASEYLPTVDVSYLWMSVWCRHCQAKPPFPTLWRQCDTETARWNQLYDVRLMPRLRGQLYDWVCCRDCEVKPTVQCQIAVETARSSQLYDVRLLSGLRGQANCTMSDWCRDCYVKPTMWGPKPNVWHHLLKHVLFMFRSVQRRHSTMSSSCRWHGNLPFVG